MFKGLLERKFIQMERPIKGGYILISLGLVALQIGASLKIDYERITKTKKHIVLTGIKVGSEVMPDIAVEPIIGTNKVTFKGVYGFDLEVASNGSVTISESEETPNVEEAQSGTIVSVLGLNESGKVVKGGALPPNVKEAESGTPVSMLGLDEDGKVVKGAIPIGGTKLYKHVIHFHGEQDLDAYLTIITTISQPFTRNTLYQIGDTSFYNSAMQNEKILKMVGMDWFQNVINVGFGEISEPGDTLLIYVSKLDEFGTISAFDALSITDLDFVSDTVTEL